jgi:hypothetical protein
MARIVDKLSCARKILLLRDWTTARIRMRQAAADAVKT